MKIIHVIDYFQPKLGYQETFLAKEHTRMGHQVSVVTSDRYHPIVYSGNAAKAVMGDRIRGSGFFVEEGIKVWRLKTLFEFPHAIWVRGLEERIQAEKPDLVIAHGVANFFTLRVARLKKRQGDFRLVIDDHMTSDNSTSRFRVFYPCFRLLFARSIRRADALVAVLPETARFMHDKYGIPPERITIIPLGAEAELFHPDPRARREIRQRLSISDDDVVFIYAGKITPIKRLPLLVTATSQLMRGHDNVKVLILGSGSPSYIEEIKRLIDEHDIRQKFIWHKSVSNQELPRFYSAADVAVWPYGSSISQREAMACGLPLIISGGSLITELVTNSNGLLYREGDAQDLAEQMRRLLNADLRKEMGANSRRFIEEKLSWKIIAEQFLSLVK